MSLLQQQPAGRRRRRGPQAVRHLRLHRRHQNHLSQDKHIHVLQLRRQRPTHDQRPNTAVRHIVHGAWTVKIYPPQTSTTPTITPTTPTTTPTTTTTTTPCTLPNCPPALQQLIENPALRQQLGREAHAQASQRFSMQRSFEGHLAVIREALHARPSHDAAAARRLPARFKAATCQPCLPRTADAVGRSTSRETPRTAMSNQRLSDVSHWPSTTSKRLLRL
jgi:hypothetical protein